MGDSLTRRLTRTIRSAGCNIAIARSVGVSGAKVRDIKALVKRNQLDLHPRLRLIVWLGTNDIFSKTPLPVLLSQYKSLLRQIRKRWPGIRLTLLGLPYFPRARADPVARETIRRFNIFLHSLSSPTSRVIFLADTLAATRLYHRTYPRTGRPDGIHLNEVGNKRLIGFLEATMFGVAGQTRRESGGLFFRGACLASRRRAFSGNTV